MAASHADSITDDPAPPGYRPVELPGLGDRRWIHQETGLAVDIMRFGRYHSHESTGTPDWYEHRVVVRPGGPAGRGRTVSTIDAGQDVAEGAARDWMAAHPDGVADLEAN